MNRTLLILSAAALSGCMSVTDFRQGFGGFTGSNRTTSVTPAVAPALPAPAPVAPVMTAKERLVSAIEGQGCELNASNVGAVLTDATITREELLQLTPQLQSEGRVAVSGSGAIRVISSQCT
ncbi:MAG: hypothetical protein P8P56_05645 [Yoonia sp.]|nr:hypothetical protein [Yoonia sp.]MDG1863473.1 hypothetical protein [Yoonia sp.]